MQCLNRLSLLCVFAGCAAMSNAFTMATFADPAPDGSMPLFTLTGSTIQGSWTGTGLNLLTPGWPGADVMDAQFTMDPVTLTGPDGNGWDTGAGTIHFTDSSNNTVLDINFDSGFVNMVGFGANTFIGSTVTFSGPNVPANLTQGSFSFGFANQQQSGDTTTATASFTSSAVPEPTSVAVFGLGLMGLLRRRRKA